jgi:20S proteasome alpha/beta subunit
LAPLVVGVVCKDAVLLLALHTAFAEENNDGESFLLFADPPHDDRGQNVKDAANHCHKIAEMDLSRSYRGPFRIYPLDSAGTIAMTCVGWRTDGQYLAEVLQSMDQSQTQMFGLPSIGASIEYGSFLACQASQKMAELWARRGRRPLSTVALMATTNALWLIDATGAFRIRACAIGGGSLSAQVNEYLQEREWSTRSCNDVAKELLDTMFDDDVQDHSTEHSLQSKNGSEGQNESNQTKWHVPQGSVVEMMAVGRGQEKRGGRKLIRLFSSALFG